MKIKLYYDKDGIGKAGETVTVTDAVGHQLNSAGECVILDHRSDEAPASVSKLVPKPEGSDSGNAE